MSYACLQQRPTEILQAPRSPKAVSGRGTDLELPANALLAQLVEHFHGKEGVDGSSPSEGFPGLAGVFCIVVSLWFEFGGHLGATSSARLPDLALR